MKPCPVCHKDVEVEVRRVEKDGLGIWRISCCDQVAESPAMNVVVQIWDALERDREDL